MTLPLMITLSTPVNRPSPVILALIATCITRMMDIGLPLITSISLPLHSHCLGLLIVDVVLHLIQRILIDLDIVVWSHIVLLGLTAPLRLLNLLQVSLRNLPEITVLLKIMASQGTVLPVK